MVTITRFEDIEAWKKARVLRKVIYALTRLPGFNKDFELRNQIRDAAISVMSNIAEGFERGGSSEFNQFLSYARGSAGEVESELYAALDEGYVSPKQFEDARALAVSTRHLIAGFMNYLQSTPLRGDKYGRRAGKRRAERETEPETGNPKPETAV